MIFRRPGRLLNVLCTFNLRPVSTGIEVYEIKFLGDGEIWSAIISAQTIEPNRIVTAKLHIRVLYFC